jgi:hypothetical protein
LKPGRTGARPDNPAEREIVSGNEVQRLAAEAGISPHQAWELIREHGLDRAALDAAARSLKRREA